MSKGLGMTIEGSAETPMLCTKPTYHHFDPFGAAQGGLREKSRSVHALNRELREGQGPRTVIPRAAATGKKWHLSVEKCEGYRQVNWSEKLDSGRPASAMMPRSDAAAAYIPQRR